MVTNALDVVEDSLPLITDSEPLDILAGFGTRTTAHILKAVRR